MFLVAAPSPSLPLVLIALAVIVLAAGRFHFLFQQRTGAGDFPTGASHVLWWGSLVIFNLLLAAALVLWAGPAVG